MKVSVAVLSTLAPAGCNSVGQLDPQAAAKIDQAFAAACSASALAGLDAATAGANANVKAGVSTAKQMCAYGAPIDASMAGLDARAILHDPALAPYLAKIKIRF